MVPQLHSSDKVVDVPGVRVVQILRCECGGDSRLPQLQLVEKTVEIPHVFLDKVVEMPVIVNDRCLVSGCRKLRFLRSCSSPTRCGRPCDLAATLSRCWRCLRISSSPDLVDTQFAQRQVTVGCGDGLFDAFRVIFRAPPGCPGVERQFLEPSMTKSSSLSRAPLPIRLW